MPVTLECHHTDLFLLTDSDTPLSFISRAGSALAQHQRRATDHDAVLDWQLRLTPVMTTCIGSVMPFYTEVAKTVGFQGHGCGGHGCSGHGGGGGGLGGRGGVCGGCCACACHADCHANPCLACSARLGGGCGGHCGGLGCCGIGCGGHGGGGHASRDE